MTKTILDMRHYSLEVRTQAGIAGLHQCWDMRWGGGQTLLEGWETNWDPIKGILSNPTVDTINWVTTLGSPYTKQTNNRNYSMVLPVT